MRIASCLPPAALALAFAGCMVGDATAPPGDEGPDAGGNNNDTDAPAAACGMPETTPAFGALTASSATQRNQPGSQGTRKIYTAAATLPGSDETVQVELWDNLGAFAGGLVAVGTYPLTGPELSYATCGVCVVATATDGVSTQTYFATGGTVEVVALGPVGSPLTVEITDVTFGQIDPAANNAPVPNGCSASMAGGSISGPLVNVDGGGGGGGGGGGA
jgi:hypothetical protein